MNIFSTRKVNLNLLGSLICILSFFLITVSLYSSLQKHPQLKKISDNNFVSDGNLPNITIFAAPRPFTINQSNVIGARQELAVRSWLSISPCVNVVLFGQDPFIGQFASKFGNRVVVESEIDFSFSGTPFFHSMVARSQASLNGISILVDPTTILLPRIINTLQYIHKLNCDWFLVSSAPSTSDFPFNIEDSGHFWLQKGRKTVANKKLQEYLRHNSQWNNCSERILMAWNNGDSPLHAGVLPPFLYGKGLHNEWLINEILSSDFRPVIDASSIVSSFFLENLRPHDTETDHIWEYRGNYHLASRYGSLYFNQNNTSPLRLAKCLGKYHLLSREKQLRSTTRYLQFQNKQKLTVCMNRERHCSNWHKVSLKIPMPLNFLMSLESLLKITADEDKTVVLAVAGDNYRDMLMNWVCRLRNLAVTNFIVCALDPDVYQFSVLQGLPVFKDPLAPSNISFNDCHFGTKCFQRVTKVKSRIVLQILNLGYNVLMSDVDVYWFENPLPFLRTFGPGKFLAQSDEYKKKGPINLPRRLNSGFYFAYSDTPTITALKTVVKHASTSDLSEQPSFYDVLCGEGGSNRIGDDQCLESNTKLNVIFLNRTLFPNGAYKGIWEESNVRSTCIKLGCIVLHNNWISGKNRKFDRQLRSGLWDYDSSSRMCIQNWQRTNN